MVKTDVKTCRRCGRKYESPMRGGGQSRYCIDCRVIVMAENQAKRKRRLRMAENRVRSNGKKQLTE